jgi:hypothetical protein
MEAHHRAISAMKLSGRQLKFVFCSTLACAALATLAPPAAAQYYYSPPPSYYQNDTATGAVAGGGIGAVTGALIGGKKNGEGGALIGLGVGALTGGLIGKGVDNADQRQAAYGSAVAANANAQSAALAVTNFDLAEMTRAGCSEDLIISTIRNRGVRVDLSPSGLIALKQQGVSDRVVIAAQEMTSGGYARAAYPTVAAPPVVVGPPAYYVRPAPVYYYRPAPVLHFDFGYGGGHHHHHHGHHHRGHW